jgi:non-homologous end joining protein Ku
VTPKSSSALAREMSPSATCAATSAGSRRRADIIKGYEVGKGDYIELDPSKRIIDIDEFVLRMRSTNST